MISFSGIAIFVFGNKKDGDGNIISANGVMREFEIAIQRGLIPIPLASTGYVTNDIYEFIAKAPDKYYPGLDWMMPLIAELASDKLQPEEMIKKTLTIIQKINK